MSEPEPGALAPRPPPPRRWGRRLRPWLVGAALAAAVGGLVLALRPAPLPVDVAVVARGPLAVTVDDDGVARVRDRYTVSAPLHGRLARLELHPGDTVKAGQVVARIAPVSPSLLDARTRAEAQSRLAAARTAVRQAQGVVSRAEAAHAYAVEQVATVRRLTEGGARAPGEIDRVVLAERTAAEDLRSARFGAQIAAYEVRAIEATLGRAAGSDDEQHEVKSPVDGRVLRTWLESEGAAAIGTPILEIGDPSALEVVVDVLTADAVRVAPGAPVVLDGWGGEPLQGHVRLVEPSAFTRMSALGVEEQRVNLIIDLDGDPASWARLGDGWRVEAHVLEWRAEDVLVAPTSAVFREGDGYAVYRVEDGIARRRPVEVGRRTGLEAEVVGGLAPGDVVVVYPGDAVDDGVRVAAR